MQNMGIEVLFKGINSLRLWQGLWVTIRIALISMVFSIILWISSWDGNEYPK